MEYKERIRKSFSKAAPSYDQYAFIQKQVAARLIDRTEGHTFKNILEIGCGTGNYTKMLRQRFPAAHITAIDFSAKMIAMATLKMNLPGPTGGESDPKRFNRHGRVRLLVEDGEAFFSEAQKKYDLITSNSTFQWFTDLEKGLAHCREVLAPDGTILFSVMGPETFCELHAVMAEVFPEEIKIAARYFAQFDDVTSILNKIFKDVKTSETVLTREYEDLLHLFKTMKYTGVNIRRNGNNFLFTSALLKKIEKAYIKKSGSITTSYQVFLCEGKR
jgi:malonyl-CoA O-methyltransferase